MISTSKIKAICRGDQWTLLMWIAGINSWCVNIGSGYMPMYPLAFPTCKSARFLLNKVVEQLGK